MLANAHRSEEQLELDRLVRALIVAAAEAERQAIAVGESHAFRELLARARALRRILTDFIGDHPQLASEILFLCCALIDAKIGVLEKLRAAPLHLH